MTTQTDDSLLGSVASAPPGPLVTERPSGVTSVQHRRRLAAAVERHHQLVWRALRRFGVPERDVDDAAQHVFLTFSTHLDDVQAGKEASYLISVVVRVAANERRKLQRSPEVLSDEVDASPTLYTPEGLLNEKQLRQQLDRGLDSLLLEQRAVFVLYELEGFSLPEIAETLQIPLGTATSRLRRARAHFEEWVSLQAPAAGDDT